MVPLPLEDFDGTVFPQLGRVLWGWMLCRNCEDGKPCDELTCSGQRIAKLQRFCQYYQAAVTAYLDEAPATPRALNTHDDLFHAITTLKTQVSITKTEFCRDAFRRSQHTADFDQIDLLQATTLTVRVFLMLETSPVDFVPNRLETGGLKAPWRDDVPFVRYLEQTFPRSTHRIFSFADSEAFADAELDLRATKLRKHLGATFRATHDIRTHLMYDYRENTIDVYHHAAFMKEQLRATKDLGPCTDFAPALQVRSGSLPRELVLEVLDSIQTLIFPLSEPKSRAMLKSVVASCSFDPEVSIFEFSLIRNPGEERISYVYLAERLASLHQEIQNPRPRGWLERLLERKSGARYIMMATLVGVIFAVVLGFLSLAVSSYQTWIAYQAWKHPVTPP